MAALDHAYVDGRYLDPNKFITPEDPSVQAVAASIVNKAGAEPSARLREAYNYVTGNIRYVTDKTQWGYSEVWQMPDETLKRGLGDCEDTSFLLCSLLIALGINAHVVFGEYKGKGHAWVEAWFDSTGGILETTSGQPFTGFADPAAYHAESQVGAGPEDPLMALIAYLAPGLTLFGIGAFLMIDDAQDAFKMELSTSTTEGEPGKHGILTGITIPGLGPHLHHWWLGILLVILSIIILALGVVLWMLKYL